MFVTDCRLTDRKYWPMRLMLVAVLAVLAVTAVDAGPSGSKNLPAARVCSAHFGNDAPWFEQNIPMFECSDPQITQIYYYRWELYKAHLKDIGQRGYIVTEFLDDVGWAWNPYQSLNDATAFHINEGRWLRDNRYLDNYIDYMYAGGNDRHFSEAITAAVYGRYLANGDRTFALKHLSAMTNLFERWSDHYDAVKGLYFIEPIADATEYSIASIDASGGKDGFLHGEAFRPTINSCMYANARAISALGTLAGNASLSRSYAAKAEAIKIAVQASLWNEGFVHLSIVSKPTINLCIIGIISGDENWLAMCRGALNCRTMTCDTAGPGSICCERMNLRVRMDSALLSPLTNIICANTATPRWMANSGPNVSGTVPLGRLTPRWCSREWQIY